MKRILKVILLSSLFSINIISAKTVDTTSYNDINTNLNSFYNSLLKGDTYIYNTNKFNCSNNSCISANYNKIGLLSLFEYNRSNYLLIENSWFILDNTTIKNVKTNKIDNTSNDTISGLRPSVYLKNGVRVTGSGTYNDPWILITDGSADPIEYFKVKLNVINGTTNISEITVAEKTSGIFKITPNTNYKISTKSGSLVCNGSNKSFSTDSENNIKIESITENMECTLTLVSTGLTLKEAILRDNPILATRTNFNTAVTTDTTGMIYRTDKTEDSSYVYYYAGATTNNWVKFGKWNQNKSIYIGLSSASSLVFKLYQTMSACTSATSYNVNCTEVKLGNTGDDMYWKIIRTNEDESVRLLYAGTSPNSTAAYVDGSQFNSSYNNAMYVGYMYGTSGTLDTNRTNTNDSTIKTAIDKWYKNNLLTNYDKYISKSAIYCADRNVVHGTYSATGGNGFFYGPKTRLNMTSNLSYKCGSNASTDELTNNPPLGDKFSASTTGGGNGKLKYPVGLMTAEELFFAGGNGSASLDSPYVWYYSNSQGESLTGIVWKWTISPFTWSNSTANVFAINGSERPGVLVYSNVDATGAVSPVISLDKCVKVKGTGKSTDPYVIDEENTSCK